MKNIHDYRKVYEKSELLENNLTDSPLELFNIWFQEIEDSNTIEEVNPMTMSSIGLDGFPKSRVVLLKEFNEKGFVFYTNYESEKGKSILENPNVCLSFFWQSQERQVIIKGKAKKVSKEESDNYFLSRPIGSQLGALVSAQSEVIPDRRFLEERLNTLEIEYKTKPIIRPDYWGGYIVTPIEFEFWQGRPNRLHDRIRYLLQDDLSWKIERLSP